MFTHFTAVKGGNMATHAVTSAEETAGTLDIDFSDYIEETITGAIVQVRRAGIDVTANADISYATTVVTIATNGTDFVLTEDDVISLMVY